MIIGAGIGLFTPLSTVKSDGLPEGGQGTFKYLRQSMDAKDAQGQQASKQLKPFQYSVNALIEGHGPILVRSSL
jgi:hypothetical protein